MHKPEELKAVVCFEQQLKKENSMSTFMSVCAVTIAYRCQTGSTVYSLPIPFTHLDATICILLGPTTLLMVLKKKKPGVNGALVFPVLK